MLKLQQRIIRSNSWSRCKKKGIVMNKKEQERIAFFRYGVIGSLQGQDDKSLKEKIKELSERLWALPNGNFDTIAAVTIEKWYYAHKSLQFFGLMPKIRKDKGITRDISDAIICKVEELLIKNPDYKTSNIIRDLNKNEELRNLIPSKSTLYRYLKRIRKSYKNQENSVNERLAFEASHSCALWQTDIMYGPYIYAKVDGKFKKCPTYLIAIIDDHSRLIVHGEFFLSQTVADYASVLKTAMLKRGIPEQLYCDNGKVFLSSQIKRIGMKLGIRITHAKVRDAAAKGKIERYFRTVRDKFLEPLHMDGLPTKIEDLNSKYWEWLEVDYHQVPHSGIQKMKPIEKWLKSSSKIRLIPANKEYTTFLFHAERKVRKDGTFSLNGKVYETSCVLVGKTIEVEYDVINDLGVYVSFEDTDYGKATFLNKQLNNGLPRKNKENNNG